MARSRIKIRMTGKVMARWVTGGGGGMKIKGYTIPDEAWISGINWDPDQEIAEVFIDWLDGSMAQAPVREGGRAPEAMLEPTGL